VTEAGGVFQQAASGAPRSSCTLAFGRAVPRLKRIVAGLGFGPSDSEDILQDAFLEVTRRPPPRQREAAAVERWLVRVVINRCLLEYRRRQRFRRAAGEIRKAARMRQTDAAPTVDADAVRVEEIDRVRNALREIDGSLAAVLVLRYFCEHNATEIGDILELPPATVRSRLRTARLMLAERLRRTGVE